MRKLKDFKFVKDAWENLGESIPAGSEDNPDLIFFKRKRYEEHVAGHIDIVVDKECKEYINAPRQVTSYIPLAHYSYA